MQISIIAAMAHHRIIGNNNTLPWSLPADLQHFKKITLGKPVIMGRKTYESIGRPLPGRKNIIISRNRAYTIEGCQVVHSIDAAFAAVSQHEEVMIIGGASFYALALPYVSKMYLTIIDEDFNGDATFPEFDENSWKETQRTAGIVDSKNKHPHYFIVLEKC